MESRNRSGESQESTCGDVSRNEQTPVICVLLAFQTKMRFQRHEFSFVVLFSAVFVLHVCGQHVHPYSWNPSSWISVKTSVLPNEGLSNLVEQAAEYALFNHFNKNEHKYDLNEVLLDEARVGEGQLIFVKLQLDDEEAELSFVHPIGAESLVQKTLALAAEESYSSNALAHLVSSPVLHPFTLQGPLELYISPEGRDGLQLRLPNHIEVPHPIRKLTLEKGASVTVSGATGAHLLYPLDIQMKSGYFGWKQVPRAQLHGSSLQFTSQPKHKVQWTGLYEATISSREPSKQQDQYEPFSNILHSMLAQLRSITSTDGSLSRILAGSVDAVSTVLVPIELQEADSGLKTLWNVVVTRDVEGKMNIVSAQEVEPQNVVSAPESIVMNGTFFEALAGFDPSQLQALEM